MIDMGSRLRMIVNAVDVVGPDAPLHNLPVAGVVWVPRPNVRVAATAWILAGGAHHTGFSQALDAEHLRDFAEMVNIEFVVIDETTEVSHFKSELRWNEAYYHLAGGFR
jgi:L-arabinose isomerase